MSRSGATNTDRSLAPPLPTSRPQWIGKYRVLSELGRGGMANVYLAMARGRSGVNKLVVLKALLPELATEPQAIAMFLDEARLAAQLNHANVVQTYEVGTESDRHIIVMEYLEGQSLSSILKRAELSGQSVPMALHLRVIISVLEGLHYAHELAAYDGSPLALVHRDVSPQNVFVTYDGQVKILDFGIAKAATSSTQTATGILKGKLAYMAPEQMFAENIDGRADVYSVGCMLWAAVTGQKLWKDVPDVQIMRRVLHREIPAPESVCPECDPALSRIVSRALAPDPEQRYRTALELREALESYCQEFSSPMQNREIGRFVSALFADSRAELKAEIERQLSLVSPEELLNPGDFVAISEVRSSQALSRLREESLVEITAHELTPTPKKKRGLLLVGLLFLGALGGGFWLTAPGSASHGPAPKPPTATATHAALIEPAPAPTSAATEASRVVEAEPSAATSDVASAEPAPSGKSKTSKRSNRVWRAAPAPIKAKPSASIKKPACDEPFFIDPMGIKRVRRECM